MPRKALLSVLRRRIDRIDDRLLGLLNQRARAVLDVARAKSKSNSHLYAPAREKSILRRLGAHNRGPLTAAQLRAIFREVISVARALQGPLRVAYLGPEATYTHLAARQQFGAGASYVSCGTINEVFHEVESGAAELAVVAVENSTEGMVAQNLDLLADSPLRICGEISLIVRHCLLARPGTTLPRVKRIVAHAQGLAQCRRWLGTHTPGVPLVEAARNARAAERARTEVGTAAIAAAAAAAVYGLHILADTIQDEPGNITRFVVLATHDSEKPTGDDRTSICFSVRDEVGILSRMLRPFATHGIDLIKIESRPLRGRPWEYLFFVDLKGHRAERRVQRALAQLERRALKLKVLGSYPAAEGGS